MKKYSDIDRVMKRELQSAVWSLFKQYRELSTKDIANRIGREQSNVTGVVTKLVGLKAVEQVMYNDKPVRGLYKITKGFKK